MHRQQTFNVTGDTVLIKHLEAKIATMTDAGWWEITEDMLADIRKETLSSPLPPCDYAGRILDAFAGPEAPPSRHAPRGARAH